MILPERKSWEEAKEMIANDEVASFMVVNDQIVYITVNDQAFQEKYQDDLKNFYYSAKEGPHFKFRIGKNDNFREMLEEASTELEKPPIPVKYEHRENQFEKWMWVLGPLILIIVFWVFIMRRLSGGGGPGGQIFNIGKSRAQVFDKDTKVKRQL